MPPSFLLLFVKVYINEHITLLEMVQNLSSIISQYY